MQLARLASGKAWNLYAKRIWGWNNFGCDSTKGDRSTWVNSSAVMNGNLNSKEFESDMFF